MADFLIKNTDHWMDSLTAEQIAAHRLNDINFDMKYRVRYQKGDVIEVGPDGKWSDTQHGNGKFLIIRVPFLPEWQAKAYMETWEGEHRRRYRLWFETITDEQMRSYEIAPYVYQISTIDELLLFGQDKVDES